MHIVSNPKTAAIITHGGNFHADEVTAIAILQMALGDRSVARISTETDIPDGYCGLVVDIGFGQYDHHQAGGNGCRRHTEIPYASAGLIWRDYGRRICGKYTDNADMIDELYRIIDSCFIAGIDAVDNGVGGSVTGTLPMSLSAIVTAFNTNWDEDINNDDQFLTAVEMVCSILDRIIKKHIATLSAREIVFKSAVDDVLYLNQYVPYMDTVFNKYLAWDEREKMMRLKFVIHPSNRGGWIWRILPIQGIPNSVQWSIPDEWKGLGGKDLQKVMHVSDAKFVHKDGFIGGAHSKDGCMQMLAAIKTFGKAVERPTSAS